MVDCNDPNRIVEIGQIHQAQLPDSWTVGFRKNSHQLISCFGSICFTRRLDDQRAQPVANEIILSKNFNSICTLASSLQVRLLLFCWVNSCLGKFLGRINRYWDSLDYWLWDSAALEWIEHLGKDHCCSSSSGFCFCQTGCGRHSLEPLVTHCWRRETLGSVRYWPSNFHLTRVRRFTTCWWRKSWLSGAYRRFHFCNSLTISPWIAFGGCPSNVFERWRTRGRNNFRYKFDFIFILIMFSVTRPKCWSGLSFTTGNWSVHVSSDDRAWHFKTKSFARSGEFR